MTAPRVNLPPKDRNVYAWVLASALLAVVVWSFLSIDIKWSRLADLPADLWTLGRVMFTNMELDELPALVSAMWESISIAWLGTMIAAVFAVPMSFLAAENLVGRPIAWVMRQVFNVLRAIPEVILALAFIPMFGLSPMAGVMAIGLGSVGTLGKLFYEILEGISPDPIEAADAVGASRLQRLRWGVIPQASPELASFILYRFEVNIRASAVLGLVGAGGIGDDLAQALQFKEFGKAGLGLIVVVVATIIVDAISGAVRRRIVAGPGRSLADAPEPPATSAPSNTGAMWI